LGFQVCGSGVCGKCERCCSARTYGGVRSVTCKRWISALRRTSSRGDPMRVEGDMAVLVNVFTFCMRSAPCHQAVHSDSRAPRGPRNSVFFACGSLVCWNVHLAARSVLGNRSANQDSSTCVRQREGWPLRGGHARRVRRRGDTHGHAWRVGPRSMGSRAVARVSVPRYHAAM
jgi:hypothetical protein